MGKREEKVGSVRHRKEGSSQGGAHGKKGSKR